MKPISFNAILAFIPVFCATSALAYILAGTSGATWVAEALRAGMWATLALNAAGYFCALYHRSCAALVCNLVLSLSILLVGFLSLLDAFPGTGSRIGNQWIDLLPSIGLSATATIVLQGWRLGKSMLVSAFLSAPTSIILLYCYLSFPLLNAINQLDLYEQCVFQDETRLKDIQELRIGVLVGEHSPRILVYDELQTLIWKYARREFSPAEQVSPVPIVCVSRNKRVETRTWTHNPVAKIGWPRA